ncbi:MAG: hypothetical protein WKF37_02240 [Bryobacteraceae bacterium]
MKQEGYTPAVVVRTSQTTIRRGCAMVKRSAAKRLMPLEALAEKFGSDAGAAQPVTWGSWLGRRPEEKYETAEGKFLGSW